MRIETTTAWQGTSDGYKEIIVNRVDGEYLLPENSTEVPPKTDVKEGHHLTIIDSKWVEVPDANVGVSFKEYRSSTEIRTQQYQRDLMDAPFLCQGYVIDHDEKAILNINTALSNYNNLDGRLPDKWKTADNKYVEPVTKEFLFEMANLSADVTEERFAIINTIKELTEQATTYRDLDEIYFPPIPTVETLLP